MGSFKFKTNKQIYSVQMEPNQKPDRDHVSWSENIATPTIFFFIIFFFVLFLLWRNFFLVHLRNCKLAQLKYCWEKIFLFNF